MNKDPATSGQARPRAKYLAIVLAAAVVLIGIILMVAVLLAPQKQPYRDALATYRTFYNANVAFTAAATKDDDASIDKARTELLDASQSLGKEPVLQRDQGKELYQALDKQLTAYVAHSDGLLKSRTIVRPVLAGTDCTAALTTTNDYTVKAVPMRACADFVSSINTLPDRDYQALITTYATEYAELATIFEAIIAIPDPTGAGEPAYAALVGDHQASLERIDAGATDFATGLRQSKAAVDITDTAMALDAYLSKKSRLLF